MRADAFLDATPTADAFLDEVGAPAPSGPRRPMRGRERSIYVPPDDAGGAIVPAKTSVLEDVRMPAPTFDEERRGRAMVDQTIANAPTPAPRAPRPQRDAKGIARDIYSILGNTGVQIVKPFVDVPNMVTGGALDPVAKWLDQTTQAANDAASPTTRYDRETLAQMPEGATLDKVAHILSNPGLALNMGVPSVGSLVMPLAATKGAAALLPRTAAEMGSEFATRATVGANALMNAGDTFGQTDGDLAGRLLAAAISGAGTLAVGRLTEGGLEGQLARGERVGGWGPAAKAIGKESLQESGENLSQSIGQDVGEVKPINVAKAIDEAAIGAALAPIVAGPVNVAQVATDPARARAKVLADLLGGFEPGPAPVGLDTSISVPAPRFDPVAAAEKAMQPAQAPTPLLGYDPQVKNPPAPIVVDRQGNARPMSADEFLDAESARADAVASGLTPDVQRAIDDRAASQQQDQGQTAAPAQQEAPSALPATEPAQPVQPPAPAAQTAQEAPSRPVQQASPELQVPDTTAQAARPAPAAVPVQPQPTQQQAIAAQAQAPEHPTAPARDATQPAAIDQPTSVAPAAAQPELDANLPRGARVGGTKEIADLFERVRATPGLPNESIRFAAVGPAEVQRLRDATGLDLTGYRHSVSSSAIAHAIKRHGDQQTEQARGQEAIDARDVARVPEIVAQPDSIELAGQDAQGNDVIRYSKRFNGTTYYAEEVRTGRHELAMKSLWKTRTPPRATPQGGGDAQTSETLGRNPPQQPGILPTAPASDTARQRPAAGIDGPTRQAGTDLAAPAPETQQQASAEPAPQPVKPPETKPADLVDLRKRLSVLRSLRECLA